MCERNVECRFDKGLSIIWCGVRLMGGWHLVALRLPRSHQQGRQSSWRFFLSASQRIHQVLQWAWEEFDDKSNDLSWLWRCPVFLYLIARQVVVTGTQHREVSAGRREQFMKELEERIEEARAEHAQFGDQLEVQEKVHTPGTGLKKKQVGGHEVHEVGVKARQLYNSWQHNVSQPFRECMSVRQALKGLLSKIGLDWYQLISAD